VGNRFTMRKEKILKLAKGFRGRANNCIRVGVGRGILHRRPSQLCLRPRSHSCYHH